MYARWMSSLHGLLHGIKWIMLHGRLSPFLKPPLNNGRPITKPWRPWHYECSVDLFYFIRREDSHEYKFIEKAFG